MKGMTWGGRFYIDTVENGKEMLTDGREVAEHTEHAQGDAVLRQLKKTRAHLSIWELLCAYGEHRRAMVEALSKIIVPDDANLVMFIGSV